MVEVKGKGTIYEEKVLIAWHAGASKIVYAGAAADGSVLLGSTEPDEAAKTLHPSAEGVTGEGGKITYRGVFAKTDEDTVTWQALERTGSPLIEGPSPLYTFKRFRRDRAAK